MNLLPQKEFFKEIYLKKIKVQTPTSTVINVVEYCKTGI